MAGRQILSRMHNSMQLNKRPIAEIVGKDRVLIENHQGVLAYSREEIEIKVSYGSVVITGKNLMLMEISCDQLVVNGTIDSLQLFGR